MYIRPIYMNLSPMIVMWLSYDHPVSLQHSRSHGIDAMTVPFCLMTVHSSLVMAVHGFSLAVSHDTVIPWLFHSNYPAQIYQEEN